MHLVRLSVLILVLAPAVALAQGTPGTSRQQVGQGPYSHMHMLLEKSFLGFDVALVDVWVGPETRDRLRSLAQGRSYSKELADRIASEMIDSKNALVQLEYKRDVSLSQFLDGARRSQQRAVDAGILDAGAVSRSQARIQQAFGDLKDRGFRTGDRLIYRATGSSLRTMVIASNGKVLVDRKTTEPEARRAMLAGYFAPGTDFREPLIKSLFRK